jgi:hypothetical protein
LIIIFTIFKSTFVANYDHHQDGTESKAIAHRHMFFKKKISEKRAAALATDVDGNDVAPARRWKHIMMPLDYGTYCAHMLPLLLVVPGRLGWLSNIAPFSEGPSGVKC